MDIWNFMLFQRSPVGWFFVVLLGLVFGSFGSMLTYRLPKMLLSETSFNLFFPRSFCPKCHKALCFWDNIPLLGYLLQRGRCRHCGEAIPRRYLYLELLSLVLSLYAFVSADGWIEWLLLFSAALGFLYLAWIDAEHGIVPDEITGTLLLFWLALYGLGAPEMLVSRVLGLVLGAFQMLVVALIGYLWLRRAPMGFGDIKFVALAGFLLGPRFVAYVPVVAVFLFFAVIFPAALPPQKAS